MALPCTGSHRRPHSHKYSSCKPLQWRISAHSDVLLGGPLLRNEHFAHFGSEHQDDMVSAQQVAKFLWYQPCHLCFQHLRWQQTHEDLKCSKSTTSNLHTRKTDSCSCSQMQLVRKRVCVCVCVCVCRQNHIYDMVPRIFIYTHTYTYICMYVCVLYMYTYHIHVYIYEYRKIAYRDDMVPRINM